MSYRKNEPLPGWALALLIVFILVMVGFGVWTQQQAVHDCQETFDMGYWGCVRLMGGK